MLPKKFFLFGTIFIYDNVYSWYGFYPKQKLAVNILELDDDEHEVAYSVAVYHEDELINCGYGITPLLALIDSELHDYLDSITHINDFLEEIKAS